MDEIKEMLDEEIKEEIENLSNFELGSNEASDAVDNLVELYKLKLDQMKMEKEFYEQTDARESEEEFKNIQIQEQRIDRYVKIGLETAGIVLPMIFYASWMKKGFKFEETGTFTSNTFRGLFQKFKPTKR